MTSYPEHVIEAIHQRVSLAEVVGKYVRLTRKGNEYSGLCPFHGEKTPSFSVNEAKGVYYCFGCQARGDALEFIMQMDKLSFGEAVAKLAQQYGIAIPEAEDKPEQRRANSQLRKLEFIMETACKWYTAQLHNVVGRDAHAYLQERGLTPETLNKFRIGYAPGFGQDFKKAMLAFPEIKEQDLVTAGLLIEQEDKRQTYPRFRNRVMFPICDRRGKVVAFGARIMPSDQENSGPKYLNSPETPLFKKGELLFAENLAVAGLANKNILVTEGYMDVIQLHQHGFTQAVATLGTAITEANLQRLWRLSPEPIICLDGDRAGLSAAKKAAMMALPHLKANHSLRFLLLPKGHDPDSMLRAYGASSFAPMLDSTLQLSDFLWQYVQTANPGKGAEDIAKREAALNEVISTVIDANMQKALRESFYQKKREQTAPKSRKYTAAEPARSSQVTMLATQNMSERTRIEALLLTAVLLFPNPLLYEPYRETLALVEIAEKPIDKLRKNLLTLSHSLLDTQSTLTADIILKNLHAKGMGEEVTQLLHPLKGYSSYFKSVTNATIGQWWDLYIQQHILAQMREEYQSYLGRPVTPTTDEAMQNFYHEIKKLQRQIAETIAQLQPEIL